MKALEAELLRTAPTTCDRIEFPHLTVYFEKILMAPRRSDRAGISRASSTLIILRASRVIPGISIAYHEMTHLLLAHNPAAPRNRDDLSPEEDARATAIICSPTGNTSRRPSTSSATLL
ncbi:MAG TPA: hypothetical protein VKH42_17855 [Vicinamibacterales bacterium]|nr:hypothetical protein [Vicinamibacterales bacterium]